MVDVSQMPVGCSADALFVEVYDRLKATASRRLAGQRRNGTLDTTELVHEPYLRMGVRPALQFQEPAQFFACAARAMRHLLVNRARSSTQTASLRIPSLPVRVRRCTSQSEPAAFCRIDLRVARPGPPGARRTSTATRRRSCGTRSISRDTRFCTGMSEQQKENLVAFLSAL